MTLFESILIFVTLIGMVVLIMIMDKQIEDNKYHINLIKEVELQFARTADSNFDIVDRQIEALKGPTYGPMLEDDE